MNRKEVQQELVNALEMLANLNSLVIGSEAAWSVAGARGHINDALIGLSEREPLEHVVKFGTGFYCQGTQQDEPERCLHKLCAVERVRVRREKDGPAPDAHLDDDSILDRGDEG